MYILDNRKGGKTKKGFSLIEFHNLYGMQEKKLIKQTVGIDVACKKIDVSLGRMDVQTITEIYAYKTFSNDEKGFDAMILWVKKRTLEDVSLRFIMEATGVYHERLAHYLSGKHYDLSIVMPNKITNFFRTLEAKTITDKSMSATIALFGLEKNPQKWEPVKPVYREMRQLTRERDQLICERTMIKNHLHAEQTEAYPNEQTIKRIQSRVDMINGQIKEITVEIGEKIKEDKEVKAAVYLVTSIPGIGVLSAATILSETDGFALINNRRQLASYAGLDVKLKDSGTSIHGKPQISKKGNRHLRKAMHQPALSAIRHVERFKEVYKRIVGKTGIKMKGVVAVQRLLLEMTYTIFKSKTRYQLDYIQKQAQSKTIHEIEAKPHNVTT